MGNKKTKQQEEPKEVQQQIIYAGDDQYDDYYPTTIVGEYFESGEKVPVSSYGIKSATTVYDFHNQKQYVVPSFNTKVKKISCGDSWFVILTEDGSVYHKSTKSEEYTKKNEGSFIEDIGCGHTIYALRTNSNSIILGRKDYTQKEQNFRFDHSTFKNGRFKQLIGGISHMIFLVQVENNLGLAEDQLYTFGYNNLNALGTQANLDAILPWDPIALRGKTINQIGCGGYHTMFLSGTQVYCVGYNANGELGTGDSTGIQDVKEMTWLKEPIRHISCGHFSTVFITTDNRILVTGCNEGDSLGVGQNFKGNPYVFNVQEMKQFDFITENIFVGGYHWFVKTIRNDLYYTGKPRTERNRGDIAPVNPDPTFIKCTDPIFSRKPQNLMIACGNAFSVVYWPYDKGGMHFTAMFVDSLVDGEEKANKFADVIICRAY